MVAPAVAGVAINEKGSQNNVAINYTPNLNARPPSLLANPNYGRSIKIHGPDNTYNIDVHYSTDLTHPELAPQSPVPNPVLERIKTLSPVQQISVIGRGTDPEVIANHPTKINPYVREKEKPTETQTLVKTQTTNQTTNLTPQEVLGPFIKGFNNNDLNTVTNQVLQITNGLTLPEIFNILSQYGININNWANANITISGNKIILNYTYSGPLESVLPNQSGPVGNITKNYTLEIENVKGWVVVKYKVYQTGTYEGTPFSPSLNENYYVINPITKKIAFTGPDISEAVIWKQPLMSPSDAINGALSQYGYTLAYGDIEKVNNLQPGQSITVYAIGNPSKGNPYGAQVKIINLGNGQYEIQSTTPLYDNGQWINIDESVNIPTVTENVLTGSISTTNYNIVGYNTLQSSGSSNATKLATYEISESYPITYKVNNNQITFQFGNPTVDNTSLYSINVPTITTQQLQALQSGQNTNIKPGWYYNPDTGEFIQISYQTVQQPQINWNALQYGYSSAYSQTVQNLPQNTYLFLNPMGYSSTSPNAIYSIGVNLNTNTVYLINSYGQIIKTQTFSNQQSMLDYLQSTYGISQLSILEAQNPQLAQISVGATIPINISSIYQNLNPSAYNAIINNISGTTTNIPGSTISIPTTKVSNTSSAFQYSNLSTYQTTTNTIPGTTTNYSTYKWTNYTVPSLSSTSTSFQPVSLTSLYSSYMPSTPSYNFGSSIYQEILGAYHSIQSKLSPSSVYSTKSTQTTTIPSQLVSSSQFSYYIQNNIPAGTYMFSTGNNSSDPNAIAYVGVNYLTNTVYLLNSSGQVIGTQTFGSRQAMYNYLNQINPNVATQAIMKYNDILVTNASNNFIKNPLTALQDLSTITTAGFSTALLDIGLTRQAESIQNFAQQLYYNPTLGDIVGGLEIGGLIALGIFAPELLLEFGTGALLGAGIGEGISLLSGQGLLSPSQLIAQMELGGVTSVVAGLGSSFLSAAFSKGAGTLTTMITGSEEWGSKIAGLTPLWRGLGSFVVNAAITYPFFRNNPKEWLEWSTLFSLGDVFIPSIAGSILSRWDVWRGKAVMAEKGPIKLPLEKEPIEGYIAKLPDNTVLNIVPRATAGEGTVPEFIQRYVYEVGENNLLSHVTPSMTFVNDLAKGEEVEIMPTSNPNAWDWRIAAGNTGLYLSPGESPNEAVALGFYGGITDTHPSLEYPRFQRIGWREAFYRFLHPFDRAGIILTNRDTAVGPLPPKELLDYIDYLRSIYGNNPAKIVDALLKDPKYGPMYMEWKNAVKEFSATTGTPVVGSEDITGLSHERQFVIEPGAKLKGTGVTYNVWIRQTPELLENLPGPLKDLLSDWFKVRVTRADIIPGNPTDLFVIKDIKTQGNTVPTNEKYEAKETTLETSNIYERPSMITTQYSESMNSITEPSESIRDISEGKSDIIKGSDFIKETKTEETYYGREARYYRMPSYTEYVKEPLYSTYSIENRENIENAERARYSNYNRGNEYIENTRETGSYEYNRNEYRENYNNREYRIKSEERPFRENYREYRINEHPYRFHYYRFKEYLPEQPPYIPYNPEEEQPNKNKNPPGVPPFNMPFFTVIGNPAPSIQAILGRPKIRMSDVAYAFYKIWR